MTSPRARFFDLSLDLLATANKDGYFVDLNAMWTATLGYELDELRQKPLITFVHPDDKEATLREAAKLFQGHVTIYFENRYRAKDGSYRWLAWNSRLSQEDQLIVACARDITDAKLLQLEKEQAYLERDRFRALADSTSDFVGMADLQGRAIYINRAGRQLLGAPDLDVETVRIAECYPADYAARILNEGLPHAAAHGVWNSDGLLACRDGRLVPISQVVVALKDGQGQLAGYGMIIRDLSIIDRFKKLEHELRTQESALREMLHAMSTPIIPITEQIVVMPLIGAMDTFRAEQFLEAALQGAETRRAQVVIIDITGLRHIDTSVAGTLVKTSAALRLLGAHVVLTGIRAEIARTLVGLGVDLATLKTHGTLQSGITYALHFLGEALGSRA